MRYILIFVFLSARFFSQEDSLPTSVSLVGINLGGQLPSGDLVKRFGPNLSVGGSYTYKTNKNFLFGIESNYFWSRNVKEDVLAQMKVDFSNGQRTIIDNEGYPADIRLTQRGLGVHLFAGKIFKFLSANKNSGIMVNVGVGYMQHKIHIFDAQQKIASVKGDLKFGYDRLTNGVSLFQFVGYLFMSKNRFSNFYAGFETYQGFTKSVRKFNYDTGLPDTERRLDVLTGFRIGWILPLYSRNKDEFYYY